MRGRYLISAVLALLMPLLAAEDFFQPSTAFDSKTVPGGIARILVRSASAIDALSAVCVNGGGKTVSTGTVFRLQPGDPQSDWEGIIGLPSTLPAGIYRLVIEARSREMALLQDSVLEVHERTFLSEDIPLDQGLTTLRTVPDPKKTQEAKEFARVLATHDANAVFEKGVFLRPVEPLRTSAFYGDRRRYLYADSRVEVSVHYGVDYALPDGKPVAACGMGKVVFSGMRILTGNTIVIEHMPGVFSLYYHMSARDVKTGEIVDRGRVIGKVGSTGLATGPHLHWEVQVSGVAVDPEALFTCAILDKNPVFDSIFPLLTAKGGE
jgi:murein DD-endopeptidase MepM/ murein hydrolase activator NlpD